MQASEQGRNPQKTTPAMKRKREWKKEITRIGTWNVMSWTSKEEEIIEELKNHKIDIAAINETKKKGKGKIKIDEYILIYSGVAREKRGHSGVGIAIHKKYENNIEEEKYINDRILQVTLNIKGEKIHLISLYAPDMNKNKEEREQFYKQLQAQIDTIRSQDKILLMGDFNARIGKSVLAGVTQRFNEEDINDNGDMLKTFCALNALRINNTFYNHKMKYKYTWQNTRGQQSVIDYFITNRKFEPQTIIDVRTLNSANVGSDHKLVLCKLRLKTQTTPKPKPVYVNKFNMESFENESTKQLYESRLKQKISQHLINERETIDQQWTTINQNIIQAAKETLGQRRVNVNKINKTPWFSPEIKELAKRKKRAYIQYIHNKTQENWNAYVSERNLMNTRRRQIKQDHWEKFTKGMESDLYGAQKKIWGMLRRNKQEIKDTVQTSKITVEEWQTYFKNMYNGEEQNPQPELEDVEEQNIEITVEQTSNIVKQLKNRKSPGPDDITNEMLKYGGSYLYQELTKLFTNIIKKGQVPKDWKDSITIPIFKKGQKTSPENYRGITLLNSTLKAFTKIMLQLLSEDIQIRDEQQGFRKNRSTIDAIFIIKQISEKAREFNSPAYMCFVDMTKAFDRVQLPDVIQIMKEKHVNQKLINLIYEINMQCKTNIKVGHILSEDVQINTGIRQGDSLSPFIFNLIMDRIMENLPRTLGYRMGNTYFHIVCYADDAVLIADSEDNLQRLLYTFNQEAKKLNMTINTVKTKCLVASKEPIRCKLEVQGKIIEQVSIFNYLGTTITSYGDLQLEVKQQTMKASQIAGRLKDIVWKNKYFTIESKIKIYKTAVRPILTYAVEARADTRRTIQRMRTTEMKVIRDIHGKTLYDRVRSEELRELSNIPDVSKWARERRKHWDKHVNRMDDNTLVKKAKLSKPVGRRSQGRPMKRWRECWSSTSEEA